MLIRLLSSWICLIVVLQLYGQTYELDSSSDGTTVNTCSGSFYDSGGSSSKYKNNEDYSMTFCSDNGEAISLDFTSFNVENGYDFFYVYDGPNTSSSQISGSPFSGNGDLSGTVTSSGTCLTFRINTDSSVKRFGWAATISCASSSTDYLLNSSNDGTTITTCEGNFYDSGGSGSNYSNDQDYSITFCSDNGDQLSFDFTSFNVENGYDFFYVYDGPNTSSSQISGSPFSGSGDLSGTIISSSTCMTFRIVSDYSVTYLGWAATITCYDPGSGYLLNSSTDGTTVTTCSGSFYDSGGSGADYSNNQDYSMTFCGENSQSVQFDFTSFNLESGYDFFYVYDGPNTSSSQISGSPFSGSGDLSGTITSSGNCMTFRIVSDFSITEAGWAADISCVAPQASLIWEDQGYTDGDAIPSSIDITEDCVDVNFSWSTTTDGGTFIPFLGSDFIVYDSGTQGGHNGFIFLGFDNSDDDPDDYIEVNFTFDPPVTGFNFSVLDIDGGSWDDGVEITYNTGTNIKTNSSLYTMGSYVDEDNESYMDGFESDGNGASPSGTQGNLDVDFGSIAIDSISIKYFCTDDGDSDPGGQLIGISDFYWDAAEGSACACSDGIDNDGDGDVDCDDADCNGIGSCGVKRVIINPFVKIYIRNN